MKSILGISAFYHDAAAAIVVDGKIVAAAQEERFTRKKHTPEFPINAIRYCLDEAGLSIDELDAVVFYDKPLLKFERLLQTYYSFAPKGLISFLKAIPVWLDEKLFLKKKIQSDRIIFTYYAIDQFYDEIKLVFKASFIKGVDLYTVRHFTNNSLNKIHNLGRSILSQINKNTAQIIIQKK